METIQLFPLLYLFSGGFFTLVWSLGSLAEPSKSKDKYWVSFILFCTAIWQFAGAISFSEVLRSVPIFLGVHLPFACSIGPALFLYYKNVLMEEESSFSLEALHFLPAFICFLLFLPYWIMDRQSELGILFKIYLGKNDPYSMILSFLILLPKVLILVYLLPVLWPALHVLFRKEAGKKDEIRRRWFLRFVALTFFLISLGLAGFILQKPLLVLLSAYGLPILLVKSYIISQRFPGLLIGIGKKIRETKYAKSRLGGLDPSELSEKLSLLMQKEKAFTDEDLTLPSLAQDLEISTHQLSEFLNMVLQTNFSDYINSWRVKEAESFLLEDPNRSILSIAHASGFNSKSSFNQAFRKFTGITPSEYRKRKKGTSPHFA
ncbi:hypothetical protein CH373_01980 [Leptospira perolatii]|uniref:HTH araC/xylS-type domain-containing protein n=1 Tax=Leptospira perolatii TaxID=2023191 RepID=A0A2M9ZRX4_9LEPT|nr:helix-turn-helix domain-containing protein [Leptospira perolatii]PJZ71296.1 hypothetical protein CH360_01980 [Leptospira perolatii]PJZ74830.1 hypothetical protein CH373_01980 [Leptospira perolatii]